MSITFRPALAQIAFAVSALVAGSAFAQDSSTILPAPGIDASGSFKQERDACNRGMTPQARATCLTEARNAQIDKSRNRLEDGSDFAANRERRCDVFKDAADRDACVARVRNAPASGNVSQGGMLLEANTPVGSGAARAMPATTERQAAPVEERAAEPAMEEGGRRARRHHGKAHAPKHKKPHHARRAMGATSGAMVQRDAAAAPAPAPMAEAPAPAPAVTAAPAPVAAPAAAPVVVPGTTTVYQRDKATGPARTPGTDTATPTAPRR